MNENVTTPHVLSVEDVRSGCGCGGPQASSPTHKSPREEPNTVSANSATFAVTGLTCGHCVGAATEEILALPGVSGVSVDLVTGGTSTVTVAADPPVSRDQVAAALKEAGDYQLAMI